MKKLILCIALLSPLLAHGMKESSLADKDSRISALEKQLAILEASCATLAAKVENAEKDLAEDKSIFKRMDSLITKYYEEKDSQRK